MNNYSPRHRIWRRGSNYSQNFNGRSHAYYSRDNYNTPNFKGNSKKTNDRNFNTPDFNNHSNISFNERDFVASTAYRTNQRPSIFRHYESRNFKDRRSDSPKSNNFDKKNRMNYKAKRKSNEISKENKSSKTTDTNFSKIDNNIIFSIDNGTSPVLLDQENERTMEITTEYDCKKNLIFPGIQSPEVKRKKASHTSSPSKSKLKFNTPKVITVLPNTIKSRNEKELKEVEIYQNSSDLSVNTSEIPNTYTFDGCVNSKKESKSPFKASLHEISVNVKSSAKSEDELNFNSQPLISITTQKSISPSIPCAQDTTKPAPDLEEDLDFCKEKFLKDFFSDVTEPTLTPFIATAQQRNKTSVDDVGNCSKKMNEKNHGAVSTHSSNNGNDISNEIENRNEILSDGNDIASRCSSETRVNAYQSEKYQNISYLDLESGRQSASVNRESLKVEITNEDVTVYDINKNVNAIESLGSSSLYSVKDTFEEPSLNNEAHNQFSGAIEEGPSSIQKEEVVPMDPALNSLDIPDVFVAKNSSSKKELTYLHSHSVHKDISVCESSINDLTEAEKSLLHIKSPFSSTQYSQAHSLAISQISPVHRNIQSPQIQFNSSSNETKTCKTKDPKKLVEYSSTDLDRTHSFSVTSQKPQSVKENLDADSPYESIKVKIESLFELSNNSHDNTFERAEPINILQETTQTNVSPLSTQEVTLLDEGAFSNPSIESDANDTTLKEPEVSILKERHSRFPHVDEVKGFDTEVENVIKEMRFLFYKSRKRYLKNKRSSIFKIKFKEFREGNIIDSKRFIVPLMSSDCNYTSINTNTSVKNLKPSNTTSESLCKNSVKTKASQRGCKPMCEMSKMEKAAKKNKKTEREPDPNLVLSRENWWEAYLDNERPRDKMAPLKTQKSRARIDDEKIGTNMKEIEHQNMCSGKVSVYDEKLEVKSGNYEFDHEFEGEKKSKKSCKSYGKLQSTEDSNVSAKKKNKRTQSLCKERELKSFEKDESTKTSKKKRNKSFEETDKNGVYEHLSETDTNPFVLLEKLKKSLLEKDITKYIQDVEKQNSKTSSKVQVNAESDSSVVDEAEDETPSPKPTTKKKKKKLDKSKKKTKVTSPMKIKINVEGTFVERRKRNQQNLTPPYKYKKLKPQPGKKRLLYNTDGKLNEPNVFE